MGLQSYLVTEPAFSKVIFYICANADLKLVGVLGVFLDEVFFPSPWHFFPARSSRQS